MALIESTSLSSFVIYEGIGGVTTVPDDLFRPSIEEAIEFLKSFKDHVDEKLEILCKIRINSKFITRAGPNETQAIRQEEQRAKKAFETLQIELQHWVGGYAGISLAK